MYFLYDVCCSLQTIFELPIGNLTIAVSAMQRHAEKFISVHIYILSLNYNGGIYSNFLAMKWCAQSFSPIFGLFAIFDRNSTKFVALSGNENWAFLSL